MFLAIAPGFWWRSRWAFFEIHFPMTEKLLWFSFQALVLFVIMSCSLLTNSWRIFIYNFYGYRTEQGNHRHSESTADHRTTSTCGLGYWFHLCFHSHSSCLLEQGITDHQLVTLNVIIIIIRSLWLRPPMELTLGLCYWNNNIHSKVCISTPEGFGT